MSQITTVILKYRDHPMYILPKNPCDTMELWTFPLPTPGSKRALIQNHCKRKTGTGSTPRQVTHPNTRDISLATRPHVS